MTAILLFLLFVYPLLLSVTLILLPLRLFGVIKMSYAIILFPIWFPLLAAAVIGFVLLILFVFYCVVFALVA